jgi:hypothetical protein
MTTTTEASSNREAVLMGADSVILHKDLTGKSIDDIIDRASSIRGGLFYHFDGKPGLAAALVDFSETVRADSGAVQ